MQRRFAQKAANATLILLAAIIPRASTGAEPAPYKSLPWHLIDVFWELPEDLPFESYSIGVTLSADVPESVNLYVAPIGIGKLSGTQFYGGLQTQSDGNTKADHQLRGIGRGLLFSMWGERGFDAIRPADGGYWQSSGHEGDFVSVRRPFAWSAGSYTYRLVKMDAETVKDKQYTWVGAFLEVGATGENIFIGALRFPGKNLKLERRNLANFVEIYGSRAVPDDEIPDLTIEFHDMRVNNQPVTPTRLTAVYPQGVPDYANARHEANAVKITLGEAADHTARTVELLGK